MTEAQKGNIFIVSGMILWSFYAIFTFLGLKGLPSIVSFFWVNIFATIFFFLIVLFRGRLRELANKKAVYYVLGTVLSIGVFLYGLQFYALTKTVPANVAIVMLFEIIPSYIFFQLIKKEPFHKKHIAGVLFAIIGAGIVLFPQSGGANKGDLIVVVSLFFAPFGNWCSQQTRKLISAESGLFLRHLLAIPFLYILTLVFKTPIEDYNIYPIIGWLILNAVLVFGLSKLFWIEAIHRMSVTRALSVNALAPTFTMIFAWILLHQLPTNTQLLSLPFLVFAVLLLTNFKFRKKFLPSSV